MKNMTEVTRYNCGYCKKDFRTPDRHECKMNPELKNCFSCKNLKGWKEGYEHEVHADWGTYKEPQSPMPDCGANESNSYAWSLELIKEKNYAMECGDWEEGEFEAEDKLFDVDGVFDAL